jgi:ABC-2 type transport system ATP-binding protein
MQYQFFLERVSVRDSLYRAGAEWMLPKKVIQEKTEWLVDIFDMREKLDDWLIRLSGGMFRKVMMMATLMSGAEFFVFDEPTPGMDVFTRRTLYSQLKRFKEESGTTIFWTTHNLHEAEQTCDRIAVLNNHLVVVTTPRKLIEDMEKADLEEAFIALLKSEGEGGGT